MSEEGSSPSAHEPGAEEGVRLHVAPVQAPGVLGDPMPHGRVLDLDPLPGRIKLRDDDFIVDEIPLYEPSGEGEHLYIRVQKLGLAHTELVEVLKSHFDVREDAIPAEPTALGGEVRREGGQEDEVPHSPARTLPHAHR